jgi:hypothetical protein
MSDVERFYEAARKKFPSALPWNRLNPFQQMQVIQAINMLLQVMNNDEEF